MYFKLNILLCIFNLLAVESSILENIFGVNNGFRNLIKNFEAIAGSTGVSTSTRWIEQDVDHFDKNETRTWKMKYFENLDNWRPNGPVYLFIGGEAPASKVFLTTGLVYDLAKETNGAIYCSEHRYYGESQPVKNPKTKEDYKFLSATQALADNAVLLKTIKKNEKFKNSKIVVVGGSYAGNLAAWMKLVYPDLVDAAIASSGPVEAKRDFYEFLEVVQRDYKNYGTPGCLKKINNIFQRYETLLKSSEGINQLKKEENVCEESDLTRPENKQLFFSFKVEPFSSKAQFGTVDNFNDHCNDINKINDTNVQYYREQNIKADVCVLFDFDLMIHDYFKKEFNYLLSWTYQTCTEFGYFQSTTSDKQPFTSNIPVELYDKICMSLFGADFNKDRVNKGVKKINGLYGGKSPNVTQVVFVNGNLDPWSSLSILEDISPYAPAIYIPKASHCKDLFPDSEDDTEELRKARKNIKLLIKKWIGADV